MAGKVFNFDKFLQEKKADFIVVKVFGIEIKVKSEIPAIFPVMLARAEETQDAAVVGNAMMRAGEIMLGKDNVDRLCEMGISATELSHLYRELFSMISGQTLDNDDVEEIRDDDRFVKKENKAKK